MQAAVKILEEALFSHAANLARLRLSGERSRASEVEGKCNDIREALWYLGADEELLPPESFRAPIPPGAFTPLEKL